MAKIRKDGIKYLFTVKVRQGKDFEGHSWVWHEIKVEARGMPGVALLLKKKLDDVIYVTKARLR